MPGCACHDPHRDLLATHPEILPIRGLLYFPNFLSAEEEQTLLQQLDANPYSNVISRRQQFYGETYYHTTHNLPQIQPESADPDARDVSERPLELCQLQWVIDKMYAEPYRQYEIFPLDGTDAPTQALVNEYVETQNISSHFEDFEAFGPVIATVSLCSPVYMTLKKPREKTNGCQDIIQETKCGHQLILEPRSLLIMKEDARYEYRHGIPRAKLIHMPDGTVLRRDKSYRRVSITIRKLLQGRKRVQLKDAELTFGQKSFDWQSKGEQSQRSGGDEEQQQRGAEDATTETPSTLWKDYHSWRRKG